MATLRNRKDKARRKIERKPTVSQNMSRTCRTIAEKYRRDGKLGKLLRLKNMMSNLTFRIQRDLLLGFVVNAHVFYVCSPRGFSCSPPFFSEKRFSS